MRRRISWWAVLAIAVCAVLTACSSSGGSSSKSSGSTTAAGAVIKFGVLYDATGPLSAGQTTVTTGMNAYVDKVNAAGGVDGHKLAFVTADTGSTPTGALSAAQKLVQQDGVFAIVEHSAVFIGAAPYLKQAGIPVVGSALDGTEWADPSYTNLFAAVGVQDEDYFESSFGTFMKSAGVTKCATIAYSNVQSSDLSAAGFEDTCQKAGLQQGYLNAQVPAGSTNVGPLALAIKNSGSNGLYLPVDPTTGFSLIIALKQLGVSMKAILVPDAYGGDMLASKVATQVAQGVDFTSVATPVEAGTPAVKQMVAALAKVGVTSDPTVAEQYGYLDVSAFVAGLQADGGNANSASFITAMGKITNYNANGLLSPSTVNFSDHTPATACAWVSQLSGSAFHVVPGAPFCGPLVKVAS
jgi:branched-chain amino acid transport system substrate-binding protein